MDQELVNFVASEMRKGNDYYGIQKSLMKSDYKRNDIHTVIRLIRIVGLDNVDENLLTNIGTDRLFIKKKSGLALYFNVSCVVLLISLFIKLLALVFTISSNRADLLIIILTAINIVFLLSTIIGMYFASDWGLFLFSIVTVVTLLNVLRPVYDFMFYVVFGDLSFLDISGRFDFLFFLDFTIMLVLGFCFIKIMKKFSWRVPQ